ncbi:two-component sensor histidine kinase [Nostoc sp. NIES-3756]|uniref:PAS domain-containing sensor histidine kinase n=1 Tax=Nostoc sp. NIES-3756 TaxID=1751286 RepID=UPI000721F9D1|nr:PAS domain S-box protein [Nostoc sp. NIES-3756]BAT54201.1 two-component sensor histidine kinase [Nostoc sp. NIES-3756]
MTDNLITIDKNTYNSLQEELTHLRQLAAKTLTPELYIEYTPAAIAIFDHKMRYLLASRRWREEYGLVNEDIIGRSHDEVCSGGILGWQRIFQRCLAGTTEKYEEDILIRKDGTIDWVKWEINPWYEASGEVGGLAVFSEVITERKQAQIALADSERRLRDIAANIPGAIFQFTNRNGSWQVDYISDFIWSLAGITPEEMMADLSCFFALVHPEDLEGYIASVVEAVENATPWHYEARLIKPNGEMRWWQGDSTFTRTPSGEVIFCGVLLDITERKQAEAELKRLNEDLAARITERTTALQQTEALLQRLADNVPGMLYEFHLKTDGTMYFPYLSSGCRELMERDPQEIQNDAAVTFADIYPDDIVSVQEAIAYSAQTLQNFESEWRIITPSGKQKWLKASSKPERLLGGEVTWYGYLLDITERKQVEALLQEQEQFLRSIYEGVDQIIFVVDVLDNDEFLFSGWSPSAEKITGIREAEIVGKTPEYLHGSLEGAAVRQRYKNCVEAGTSIAYEECLTSHNQETWWLTKINPLKNSEGEIYRLVGTTLNITQRKQAELKLQQQAEYLENTLRELQHTQTQLIHSEKMSSIGNMVAGVAHEINNPVNFIHGNLIPACEYAQDLLHLLELYQIHFPHPPEEIQEFIIDIDLDFLKEDLVKLLQSMRVGTQRIREIVLSLRNFSRLDEAEFKQVNIHEGIDSTLMILQNRLKAKADHPEIVVVKEYGNLPLIDCYPGQLNQVFMNLLSNAIDALDESIVSEQLSVTTPSICIQSNVFNNNWVRISIADNGVGIPQAILSKLFDPFFTTKSVGKGTGLGLSISYQIIVDRHKGKLSCNSTLGQGAEFVIEIPINQ